MTATAKLAVVILAAGEGRRMTGEVPKLLRRVNGRTLLRRCCDTALEANLGRVWVVLGYEAAQHLDTLAGAGCSTAENRNWAEGQAGSLGVGLEHALAEQPDLEAVLVTPADQPGLDVATLHHLRDAQLAAPAAAAVRSCHRGRHGAPVILARSLFDRAMHLQGDEGARQLLRELPPGEVVDVELDSDLPLADADTEDALEDLRARLPPEPTAVSTRCSS